MSFELGDGDEMSYAGRDCFLAAREDTAEPTRAEVCLPLYIRQYLLDRLPHGSLTRSFLLSSRCEICGSHQVILSGQESGCLRG